MGDWPAGYLDRCRDPGCPTEARVVRGIDITPEYEGVREACLVAAYRVWDDEPIKKGGTLSHLISAWRVV